MKKLTTSVLAVVLTSTFAVSNAQQKKRDTAVKEQKIGEVIITGALGIKKKADAVTSAQTVVSATELTQAGNSNAVSALAGKVAGLQIKNTNSSVNGSNSIQLRGIRTITGNNDALVVIDGAISSSAALQNLPPDVIQSINVLKGAQGAALYGSDGVNGAVIVTTVQGTKRGLRVSYDGTIDFESVYKLPMRQDKYGQGWSNARDQYENGAWGPKFDGEMTMYGAPMYDYNGDGVITMDGIGWGSGTLTSGDNPAAIHAPYSARIDELKKFFTTGVTYDNGVTINVGDSDKYAMFNVNHTRRDFVIEGDQFKRTSVLFKAGAKVGKLKVDGSFNYVKRNFTQTTVLPDAMGGNNQQSLYWNLLQSAPDIPITSYKQYPDNAMAWNIYYFNPYWLMKHVRQDSNRDFFNVTAGANYEVNKNFNISYLGNLQNMNDDSLIHGDAWSTAGKYDGPGNVSTLSASSGIFLEQVKRWDYYGDLMFNFNYDLTSDLNAKLNVGHNYQEHRYQIMQNGGSVLQVPGVYTMSNVTQPLKPGQLANYSTRWNMHSLFANLDLSFKDFLFLNATAREQFSSVLPEGKRAYFYPSVGVSFVPTKAWDLGTTVSRIKVSGNWTRVGNSSAIGPYSINRTTELASGYPFNGVNSLQNSMAVTDPNIKPEFVTSKELNLELGFFNDRLSIDGSVFKQDTKDLITRQTVSATSGSSSKLLNIGRMESKGAEVNLGITPLKSDDFKWTINAGYSYNESRVLEVAPGVDEVALVAYTGYGIYAQKGALFPLIKTTMMQRDPQGRIIIDAATGNPLLSSKLENAGVATPKSIYSFSTNISFKGFKVGAVADFRLGHKFIAQTISGMAFNGSLYESGEYDRDNGGYVMPNSVIVDGSGNYVPNTSVKTGGNDYDHFLTYFSSKYSTYGENLLRDARAFKIREIVVSYTLPRKTVQAMGLDEMTFGVHARNPFVKYGSDNYNYADPETSLYGGTTMGIAGLEQYPTTRVFGFSVNLKF